MRKKSPTTECTEPSDPENRNLVDEYSPLVRKIAYSMARDLPQNVQVSDLVQDGTLGLLDAILRINKEMTAQQFRNFAAQRIRGAMLDGLRAIDSGTRQVRRVMRDVEMATHRLEQHLGRAPREAEVAAALGLSLTTYQQILQKAHGYFLLSLDDLEGCVDDGGYLEFCASNSSDPLVVLERKEFQAALALALKKLPVQERSVIAQYYEAALTMREIAENQHLSEGRISQIHAQAIVRLRVAILGAEEKSALLAPRRRSR